MKKILILFSTLLLVASCEWFEFDNQEGYNAQVEGQFLDSKTGQPLQFGFPNTSTFSIIEEGWDGEATQTWYVKPNGTYINKLTFEGDYRIQTYNSNYYPLTEKFSLKKGGNTQNFTVTPYARILDPKIRYDAGTKQLTATFKVEHADPSKTNKMMVAFLGFTDRFVSDGFNNFTAATAKMSKDVPANGTTEISLFVDVSDKMANNAQFKYNRVHYVRIGALATGAGVNSSYRYNLSPVYEVSSDFQTIQEITNWTED
jgi:hypothetical protein